MVAARGGCGVREQPSDITHAARGVGLAVQHGMTRARIETFVVWVGLAAACGGDPPAEPDPDGDDGDDTGESTGASTVPDAESDSTGSTAEVVYWRDIKPIIDARCGACHSADGVAPFALGTYEEVSSYGEAMLAQIGAGLMPPWPVSPDCNEYLYDPSLADAEKESITAWVELGKPEGDPADEGEPLTIAIAVLPRIDFEVEMAEPHIAAPPVGEVDEHRCFLLDWPEANDVYVTGYEVIPGNRKVVHHLVARIAGPDEVADLEAQDDTDAQDGWACGAGAGMSAGGGPLLGVWVPGAGASVLPEDTGMRIESGSKVMLNMHYNTVMGDTAPDQTRVAFMVEDSVAIEGTSQFVSDPQWPIGDNMLIEADDPESVHTFDFVTPVPITTWAGGLHMHTLGSRASLVVEHEDGTRSCAFDVPRWQFGWQLGYRLATPIEITPGDRVVLECAYDNSAGNQAVVDGVPRAPQDVTWGEDTYDEMCLGFVYVTRE